MAESPQWGFPESQRPRSDQTQFDLSRALDAMVLVRSEVPEDSFTGPLLGTERGGYGVVIRDDGLVLTIGYLIVEAAQVWLTDNRGAVVPGHPLAYDQVTGFGLIQPLAPMPLPHLTLGSMRDTQVGDTVFVLGHGGSAHSLKSKLIARKEFAGYWEYLLDEALFTSPAHPQWGGAALVDTLGDLIGIGSLLLQQEVDGKSSHINMFVPIDLLPPILDAMLKTGHSPHSPPPWLGMYTQDPEGRLTVGHLTPKGPAELAGVKAGDLVLGVGSKRAHSLAELFRAIRNLGRAGVEVPLMLARAGDVLRITVKSADRNDYLRKPRLH